MNISSDDIIRVITVILGKQPTLDDEGAYLFEYFRQSLRPLAPNDVSAIAEKINSFDEGDDGSVITKTSYEVTVQTGRIPYRLSNENFNFDDPHSGLSYRLDLPSDAYIIYLCLKLIEGTNRGQVARIWRPSAVIRDRMARSEEKFPVLDLIKSAVRVRTLSITSQAERSRTGWKQYADAFFFHVGYNLDIPLIPDPNLSELLRPVKISSMRRSGHADLDAPHRHYVADLVYHYQLGLSAESPMLEYISYYHVAEHWFENIYQDDLVEQIQLAITSPSFSYKRKKDLRELIRKISRAVQLRDEQLVINEQTALRLTLAKYIEIPQLVADLNAFDPKLLDRYATHTVSFCGGDKVVFDQPDASKIFSSLSNRIYKTRNALVHSKEGSKAKFVPFTDDRDLSPEVPLMRFVAEQIIIATSTIPS